jgi:hypothetical protein
MNGVLMALQTGSAFRALEPVVDRDWFWTYHEFFVPYEAHDLVFLGMRVAILRNGGLDIMDLSDHEGVKIPKWDGQLYKKSAKSCDAHRLLGMFRSNEKEFLLCYDGPCRSDMSATCALIGRQSLGCTLIGTVLRGYGSRPWSSGRGRRSVWHTTRRTCSSSTPALSRSGTSTPGSSYRSSKGSSSVSGTAGTRRPME